MNLSHCFPPPFPTLLIFYQISSSRLFHVALSTFYLLSLGDLVYLNMSILYAFKVPMKCFNDEITSCCPRQFHFLGTKFTSEQNSCRMNSMMNQSAIILATGDLWGITQHKWKPELSQITCNNCSLTRLDSWFSCSSILP